MESQGWLGLSQVATAGLYTAPDGYDINGHIHPVQEVTALFITASPVANRWRLNSDSTSLEIDLQNSKGSARAQLLRTPHTVYEVAAEMAPTEASKIVKELQKKAVVDVIMKIAEEEAV